MNKSQRRIVWWYLAAIVVLTFFAPTKWWHATQQIWLSGGRDAIWFLSGNSKVNYAEFLLELGVISLVMYVLIVLKGEAATDPGRGETPTSHAETPPAPRNTVVTDAAVPPGASDAKPADRTRRSDSGGQGYYGSG